MYRSRGGRNSNSGPPEICWSEVGRIRSTPTVWSRKPSVEALVSIRQTCVDCSVRWMDQDCHCDTCHVTSVRRFVTGCTDCE
ncbi:unnamed protein product [Mycena citricolor]|uniref:Uncharacterized protein n=1 Tax=Mycena citricolor TaxID=2018698 RepID=A0AAD2H025_9AGAR|nr:unnamed protein product [Mycena citricolor]